MFKSFSSMDVVLVHSFIYSFIQSSFSLSNSPRHARSSPDTAETRLRMKGKNITDYRPPLPRGRGVRPVPPQTQTNCSSFLHQDCRHLSDQGPGWCDRNHADSGPEFISISFILEQFQISGEIAKPVEGFPLHPTQFFPITEASRARCVCQNKEPVLASSPAECTGYPHRPSFRRRSSCLRSHGALRGPPESPPGPSVSTAPLRMTVAGLSGL